MGDFVMGNTALSFITNQLSNDLIWELSIHEQIYWFLIPMYQKVQERLGCAIPAAVCHFKWISFSYFRGKHFSFCMYKLNFILNVLLALVSPGPVTVSPERAGYQNLTRSSNKLFCWLCNAFMFSPIKAHSGDLNLYYKDTNMAWISA